MVTCISIHGSKVLYNPIFYDLQAVANKTAAFGDICTFGVLTSLGCCEREHAKHVNTGIVVE